MDGKQKDTRDERWLARAAAAYERMFGGKSQEEPVTLTEREDMAVSLGKELAAFLLEEHVAANPAKAPAEACTTKPGRPLETIRGAAPQTLPRRRLRPPRPGRIEHTSTEMNPNSNPTASFVDVRVKRPSESAGGDRRSAP